MFMDAVEPGVSFIIASKVKPNRLGANPTEWVPGEEEEPRYSWGFLVFWHRAYNSNRHKPTG